MAKRKTQHKQPSRMEFHAKPFSALKGVIIPERDHKPAVTAPDKVPASALAADDTELFFQAMDNVKPLESVTQSPKSPKRTTRFVIENKSSLEREKEEERSEHEVFSKAIRQLKLDVTFSDGAPEHAESKPLGANRLRQLKRGVISIERQLDLHGLTRDESLHALSRFIRSAAEYGEKAVLVITGKGNNSVAGPVLQQTVAGWLRDAGKEFVSEFAPAPRDMGGSGAFVVFLRGKMSTS